VDTTEVYRAWDKDPGHDGPNALTLAAMAVEPRLAAWRDALGTWAGSEPVLAGSGSTWFVEVRAGVGSGARAGADVPAVLRVGSEAGRLVRARTVPAGWEGD
jgi:4-diphosphocytidyl-2-C-methyl-D-erythritol kinase